MSLKDLTLDEYLTDLASDKPAPGGGAAVALIAAQGTALLSMTLAVSGEDTGKISKERYAELTVQLDSIRKELLVLADKDTRAYPAIMDAYKLPKQSDSEKSARSNAIQSAYKAAVEVPFATMEAISVALKHADDVIRAGKTAVISDAAIAIDVLSSSLATSCHNVKINLKYIKDEAFHTSAQQRLASLTSGYEQRQKKLQDMIQSVMSAN